MKLLMTTLLITAPITASAQDVIQIGPGQSAELTGFTLEREAATGVGTLILGLVPLYNPEPYGPVPPADVGRTHRAICNHYAALNADVMVQNDASNFAVRWDWTPETQEDLGFTVSRFHRNDYTIMDDGTCSAIWTVTPDRPNLPSGGAPILLHAQTVVDRRMDGLGLEMTYDWGTSLDAVSDTKLDRASQELCVSVVADEMLRREDNYSELHYDFLSVAFEERTGPNDTNRRVFTRARDGDSCIGNLTDAD